MEEVLDRIYAAAGDACLWPAALDSLSRRFGAQSASLMLFDRNRPEIEFATTHGLIAEPDLLHPYQDYYGAIDPLPPLYLTRPPGEVLVTSAIWSERENARTEFYVDYFAKSGLRDCLGATLIRDDTGSAGLSMQRDRQAGLFSADDAATFGRLVPHLRRAMQLHRQLAVAKRERTGLQMVVDRLRAGVLLLDDQARVWYRNGAAETILARRDGVTLSADARLSTPCHAVTSRLEAMILRTIGQGPDCAGGRMQLPRAEGAAPYALLVSRLPLPVGFAEGKPARGAMIVIQDPERSEAEIAGLAARFGLTASEGRLLAALLAGATLAEHSARAGISMNTTKFHLRGLFAKTAARNQADLVRIALTAAEQAAPA